MHLRNCRSGQAPADKRTPVTVRQELAELRPPCYRRFNFLNQMRW